MEKMFLSIIRHLNVIGQAAVDANIFKELSTGNNYNPGDQLLGELADLNDERLKLQKEIEANDEKN